MIVTLHAMLENIYQSNESRDKQTGEVKPPMTYAQVVIENVLNNGYCKKDLINIKINETLTKELSNKIGECVDIKCNISGNERFHIEAI